MPRHDRATVLARLTSAWQFLSGQTRRFEEVESMALPSCRDFAHCISLELEIGDRHVTVGIFMQRGDAMAVATHMFGLAAHEVSKEDLADACREVCNVMSDRYLLQAGPEENIEIGIPSCAKAHRCPVKVTNGQLQARYQSARENETLNVVVYQSE